MNLYCGLMGDLWDDDERGIKLDEEYRGMADVNRAVESGLIDVSDALEECFCSDYNLIWGDD